MNHIIDMKVTLKYTPVYEYIIIRFRLNATRAFLAEFNGTLPPY